MTARTHDDAILELQARLKSAGFDPGPIDGKMGPLTRAAVVDFQRANGLTPDGIAGPITMAALTGNAGAVAPEATRPLIRQGRAGYVVRELVLHTTATPGGWHDDKTADQMMAEVRKWHVARGWRREGYHGLGAPDGSYVHGRPYDQIGAHVIEANRGTIGLVLVPVRTVTRIGRFEDWYTPAQREWVIGRVRDLQRRTDLRRISGHNEYADKLCPGFDARAETWLQDLLR